LVTTTLDVYNGQRCCYSVSNGDANHLKMVHLEQSECVTKCVMCLHRKPTYCILLNPIYTFHINAHFLTCFLALTILRIMQKKTGRLFSAERIVECLNKISCSNEQDNVYLFDYRSVISDAIGQALGIDFTNKRLTLGAIKKVLAQAKK
jgi:hypothetical protein